MKSRALWTGLATFVLGFMFTMGSLVLAAASEKQRTENEAPKTPYNVLLIICDQESHKLQTPDGYKLPARDTLARRGITFGNHYIAAAQKMVDQQVVAGLDGDHTVGSRHTLVFLRLVWLTARSLAPKLRPTRCCPAASVTLYCIAWMP